MREATAMEKNFSSALEPRLVSTMGTFAPIITPTDCLSDIVPELTNPTTMTVVAVLCVRCSVYF